MAQTEHYNAEVTEDDLRQLKEIQDREGFSSYGKTIHYLLTSEKPLVGIPKSCESCVYYGNFDLKTGKVICVVKQENKLSTIRHRSLLEAEACSKVGTLISQSQKEEFEKEIHNLNVQVKYWQKKGEEARVDRDLQIEKLKKPQQELLTQNTQLSSRLSDMQNALLQKDSKISILEIDNNYLRGQIEKLSENVLLDENDSLRKELSQLNQSLSEHKKEIEKLEALNEKISMKFNDLNSQICKTLRNLKENLPIETSPIEMAQYLANLKKAIENFYGYLATVSI